MRADPIGTRHRARQPSSSVGERVRTALVELGEDHPVVLSHSETPWASITFEGARHTIELAFEGDAAIAAGERLIARLPDHEFTLHGWFVAEASVAAADHRLLPRQRLAVTCELLLLKDA